MGRVSRYKKVKSCDPFSKANKRKPVGEAIWGLGDDGRKPKKRSRTAERLRAQSKKKTKLDKFTDRQFDAPPEDEDEFDMRDLVGSIKKKPVVPVENEIIRVAVPLPKIKTPQQASNLDEERNTNRLLKLDKQVQSRQESAPVHQGRMEGESKNAYRRRFAAETRQIIKREKMELHNPEKRQRKKEFLNNKKKAKKGKKAQSFDEIDEITEDLLDGSEPELVTGEVAYAKRALETQVRFGEQAERPPMFKQLPRKATAKSVNTSMESKRSGMEEEDILAEQAEMELLRRKVRAQYAVIKSKRHHAGDFHL
jgi:hypothetical protein